jgi:hypothetical protein
MTVETGTSVDSHASERERLRREAALDETIEQSFPASDPPSTDPNPDSETKECQDRNSGSSDRGRGRRPRKKLLRGERPDGRSQCWLRRGTLRGSANLERAVTPLVETES